VEKLGGNGEVAFPGNPPGDFLDMAVHAEGFLEDQDSGFGGFRRPDDKGPHLAPIGNLELDYAFRMLGHRNFLEN
jgi:hypothetical protein